MLQLLGTEVFSVIAQAERGGLAGLVGSIIRQWIGPVFILAVAVFAVMFIKNRQWTQLVSFVGIAAIVGVLIFLGKDFFGESGTLTKTAKSIGDKVEETNNGFIDLSSLVDNVKVQLSLLR